MTQALSGAALAAVIAVCWLLGRPRPKLLRSTDTSAVAALNRGQIERLRQQDRADRGGAAATEPMQAALASVSDWPTEPRDRQRLLRELQQQFQAGGEQRREAMALCAAWGHRSTLPLIQRGLRDSDPAVIERAAAAIARFRGRSAAAPAQASTRAPRNVSRTR